MISLINKLDPKNLAKDSNLQSKILQLSAKIDKLSKQLYENYNQENQTH
jgi:hypothetical protein